MLVLLGILAGLVLPFQTSMNLALRARLGSPYSAALVSFSVGLVFLIVLMLAAGESLAFDWARLAQEPLWVYAGGVCGVTFITGNILLVTRIGSAQTVIFPVFGQILMGLAIDSFGWLFAREIALTPSKAVGALLVAVGVLTVATARAAREKHADASPNSASAANLWLWRMIAMVLGALGAVQVALNGHVAVVAASSLASSVISFATGVVALLVVIAVRAVALRGKRTGIVNSASAQVMNVNWQRHPLWMWFGGFLGGLYVLANVMLSNQIGTGLTVILFLIGATSGGLLVDHFALMRTARKPLTVKKLAGVALMLVGIAFIKL